MLNSLRKHAPVTLSLLAGAALWEIVGRNSNPAFLVPLSETLVRLYQLVGTREFVVQFLDSAILFVSGVSLGILVGMPLGLLFARVRIVRVAVDPYIMTLYATPMVALIPFILSIFGLDFSAKVLVVFLFCFFPVLYNTVEGARSIDPELIEVARSFRSGEWAFWRDVLIPGSFPYAMTGVRQAIGRGLVGMVAAEFFLSASGLGQLLLTSARNFDTAGLFGAVLIITLLGAVLMALGQALEDRFTAWRGTAR